MRLRVVRRTLSFMQQDMKEQVQNGASSGLSCGMLSWKKHLHCFLPWWLDCTARSCRPLEQLSVASPWNVFAERTKNFSGAEIEGLVKSAASFALNRQVDVNDLSKKVDEDNIKVMQRPFIPIHSASLSSRHKPNLSTLHITDYTHTCS